MKKRTLFIVCSPILLTVLLLLVGQGTTQRPVAAQAATPAATASVDGGAMCELMRTIPRAVSAETPEAGATATPEPETARPSNPGGPGVALKLTGDPQSGAKVFTDNCQKCHGDQGQGDVKNPGSDDGTIPALNPIDETIADTDPKVFACNVDLFVEHGSVPSGPNPQQTMTPWGDNKQLTDQQIADVIAYVMSLNGASMGATPAATAASQ